MPVVSCATASECVAAYYCGCRVVCLVGDIFFIVVVGVSCVTINYIIWCVVVGGAVFLVVNAGSVIIDTVGFLTVIIGIVRSVESSYFIIELCLQPVNLAFEVTPPHSCSPSGSRCSSGNGGTISIRVVPWNWWL